MDPENNKQVSWYMKNKEKMHESIKCKICGGRYTYYNKSHHIKSKKHTGVLEKLKAPVKPKTDTDKLKDILDKIKVDPKILDDPEKKHELERLDNLIKNMKVTN